MKKIPITALSIDRLSDEFSALGQPAFRTGQVLKWVYQKRIEDFSLMTNVAKELREMLGTRYSARKMETTSIGRSSEGDAVKFGLATRGGANIIESVLLYDGKRRTACLSSQLGCGLGCVFCRTGASGFARNLYLDEIMGQLIRMNDYLAKQGDKPVTNIVFMGMGEALANFKTLMDALRIIMAPQGFNLGGRRITVSTAGIVPSIDRLISTGLNVGLAVSLNAYNDEIRSRLMPINRKYPIAELLAAARRFHQVTGAVVTFEYVVIPGINDGPQGASALIRLLKSVPCKLNLIRHNSTGMPGFGIPLPEQVEYFGDLIRSAGITVTIRKSRGADILGACGQLRTGNAKALC